MELLIGDATRAREELGWMPKYDLQGLVKEMMTADVKLFEKEKYLMEGGHDVIRYNE